jgi:hypothetical protein
LNIEDSILSLPKDNELNDLLSPILTSSEKKQMPFQLLEGDQFPLILPLLNFLRVSRTTYCPRHLLELRLRLGTSLTPR